MLAATFIFLGLLIASSDIIRAHFPETSEAAVYTLLLVGLLLIGAVCIAVVVRTRVYRGIHYAKRYNGMAIRLRHDLLDAGVCIRRKWPLFGFFDQLPQFKIVLHDGYRTATLRIRNSIRIDKKLDEVDLSAALQGYIVERHYSSLDRNYYIYELVDARANYKHVFSSPDELLSWSLKKASSYEIAIDDRTTIPIAHCLLTGGTGSGKTQGINMLMVSALARNAELTYCDPKMAGIYSFGIAHSPERTGYAFEEIYRLLKMFVCDMGERKKQMQELLRDGVDDDYRAFGLAPHIIVIDEFSALAYKKTTRPKAERDEFDANLAAVLLQGRQLGFFVWIAMQQANAQLVSTSMRDQFQFRCVLGAAREQTYVTCFDAGADIPKRKYGPGEGVYETATDNVARMVWFPHLKWLEAENARIVRYGRSHNENDQLKDEHPYVDLNKNSDTPGNKGIMSNSGDVLCR